MPKGGKVGTIPYSKFPRLNRKAFRDQIPEIIPVPHPKGRVLYFTGCATNYLFEDVGHAVSTFCKRLGVEVIIPQGQMCCGLPIFLAGARKMALRNIRKNLELFNRDDVDAVIVDCATCGAALKKEYAHILEEMGENAEAAKALGREGPGHFPVSGTLRPGKVLRPVSARVTYHDPCHLLRSQGVKEEPRHLLRQIPGWSLWRWPERTSAAAGEGRFQWEHPDVASGITGKKSNPSKRPGPALWLPAVRDAACRLAGIWEEDSIEMPSPRGAGCQSFALNGDAADEVAGEKMAS